MNKMLEQSEHLPVIKIVSIYTLFGTLWIYFSDTILGWIVRDPELITRISIYKGLMYIFLTAALLYSLIYRHVYLLSQSRKQIHAIEERTKLFFESDIIGMAISSPEKGWLQVNDKLCRMLGYSAEEMTCSTWEQITHPDDLELSNLMFARLISGETDNYSIEKRYICKDGSLLYGDLSVGCVRKEDGTVDYVLSMLADITDRKLTEEALRSSEETFSKAFNCAPVMMMIYAEDGTYLDVNDSFCKNSGFKRHDVIGRTPVQIGWLSELEADILSKELNANGHCSGHEARALSKEGHTLECLCYCEPISVNGQQRIFSIMLDVTEQRRLEKHLRQALKMESIGRLAGGIAHDFNNKLSVILGYAEIAKTEQINNARLWHQLDEISTAALHSRDITRQLLAFSRQDLITPRMINLNDAISNSQNALSRLIGEDINTHFLPGNSLWMVRMDPAQIDQIVMNLAVNAKDAMPDGGAFTITTSNIHVSAQHMPDAVDARTGDFVCISFTDTGSGIDKKIIRSIFEPFFTTKEVGKGTGLGLATVYGIVSQNNGFIEVSSQLGNGTTFNIFLPRLELEKLEAISPQNSCHSGSGKIMVVEDEESVRKMITQMLSQLGYEVSTANSPIEAIELLKTAAQLPDVILSDVIMPGLSGKEMMQIIAAVHPGIKVIYMSGYTSDIISQKGLFEEKVNFIHKPFNISTLNEMIRKVMAEDHY
jgi:two-component system, cell cycle sensor histidine kinase and response regulator CckA